MTKNISRIILRCTGLAILVISALTLLPGIASAQITTGLRVRKTCPSAVNQGETFVCTFDVRNENPDQTLGTLTNLAVTNEVPFPGGGAVPVNCNQPDAAGAPVTILGPFGSATDTCFGSITESAPVTCSDQPGGLTDEVRASGTYADYDPDLLTSGSTTNTVTVRPVVCDDNNPCTIDSCDPTNEITDPANPAASLCETSPVLCDDNNACTSDLCDPATGECAFTPAVTCDDNNGCTTDACDPATGECVFTPGDSCDDNNACTTDACDPTTGECVFTPGPACDDNNACTTDTCDPTTGECVFTPGPACDDNDICTDDACDPATGECVFTFDPTNDPSCPPGEEICRTPGFWGTHACGVSGTCEKATSQDITGSLLDAFNAANPGDPLTICGTDITNADVGNVNSALEAICVSPKGDSVLQLARQLMSAALNCIITTGGDGESCTSLTGAVCEGVSIEDVFNACNTACEAGDVTATVDSTVINCIEVIDCFNNGGETFDPVLGCLGSSGCHEAELDNGCVDFTPPGPAGSPKACNDARKNDVEITD